MAPREGLCIAFSARWVSTILQQGTLVESRAVFTIFQVENTSVGVLNVYTPQPQVLDVFWETTGRLPSSGRHLNYWRRFQHG